MTISTVIATKDRPDLFKNCLDSVLKQEFIDPEVIIINDGSSEKNNILYKNIINNYKKSYPNIKYFINYKNKGRSLSRNIGISRSKGDIIAFIDDDAVAENNWLNELCKLLNKEEIVGVGGKIIPFKGQDYYFIPPAYIKSNKIIKVDHIIQEGNCAFKKNALIRVGCFDPKITFAHEGKDLSIRLKMKGYQLAYTPYAVIHHPPPNPLKIKNYLNRSYLFGIRDAHINKKYNRGFLSLFFDFKSIKVVFDFYLIFVLLFPLIFSILYLYSNSGIMLYFIAFLLCTSTLGALIAFSQVFKTKNLLVSGILVLSRLVEKIGNIVGYFKYNLFNAKP